MKSLLHNLILFVSIILFFSCDNTNNENRDHLVFRYNENSNIPTLDPAFSRDLARLNACNQLFSGLIQLDEKLAIKPDIAKSWKVSKDMKTYTFNLRKDVYFHTNDCFKTDSKTRNVKAQDFTYSFNRLTDPKVASSGRWVMDFVDRYQAINDSTFQIILKKPFPAYLSLLSTKYCSVVPKEAIDYYGGMFRKNPVGTGPFQFKAWEENTKLVFRKNKLYYEKDNNGNQLPYLEAVAITFLSDKQAEFLQFVQGNLDMLRSIDNSYKDELLTPKGLLNPLYQNDITLHKIPSLNSEYIGFYLGDKKSKLQNKNLRKAINYGFDRKAMISFLRNNIGTPANSGFIPKGIEGYNAQKGYSYQPEKAKAYFNKFKNETGSNLTKITLGTTSEYATLCEFIQREVQKIGIIINVEVMPAGTLRQKKKGGKISMFRASWIADYPDAENFMIPYISEKFAPNGPNYTHFKNDEFERLYRKSFFINEINERKLIYQKLDSILIEEAPIIPLFYDEAIRFDRKNVIGIPNNSQSFLYLKNVKKTTVN